MTLGTWFSAAPGYSSDCPGSFGAEGRRGPGTDLVLAKPPLNSLDLGEKAEPIRDLKVRGPQARRRSNAYQWELVDTTNADLVEMMRESLGELDPSISYIDREAFAHKLHDRLGTDYLDVEDQFAGSVLGVPGRAAQVFEFSLNDHTRTLRLDDVNARTRKVRITGLTLDEMRSVSRIYDHYPQPRARTYELVLSEDGLDRLYRFAKLLAIDLSATERQRQRLDEHESYTNARLLTVAIAQILREDVLSIWPKASAPYQFLAAALDAIHRSPELYALDSFARVTAYLASRPGFAAVESEVMAVLSARAASAVFAERPWFGAHYANMGLTLRRGVYIKCTGNALWEVRFNQSTGHFVMVNVALGESDDRFKIDLTPNSRINPELTEYDLELLGQRLNGI